MTIHKNPLGRGLESLIPKSSEPKGIIELDITEIAPNSDQPRKVFDKEKLEELADSIKNKGIIQPLIVSKIDDRYQIIAGERRWRAAGIAGLKKIPVVVKNAYSEQEKLEIAIIENIQREDLNPVELSKAYKNLIEKYSYKQEDLAAIVGKSRSSVSNSLRLLSLPNIVLDALNQKEISEGHARALLSLESKEEMLEILNTIKQKSLSVRETETAIKKLKKKTSITPMQKKQDVFTQSLSNEIENILKTKVTIVSGKKGGKIEINFTNNDELERLLSFLRGERC